MVYSENNSFFVGIVPNFDIELIFIFGLFLLFLCWTEDRSQYYKISFDTHLFSNIVIMTLNYVLCAILVQNLE